METLQSVVLPNLDLPGHEHLYVRLNDRAFCELAHRRIGFAAGGEVWTDTFYGGLTVAAWKRTSPVRTLLLELEGEGEFVASIGVHRLGHALLWLSENDITLAPGSPAQVPVQGWERVNAGMLFLRLRARRAGWLTAARYRTEDPAPKHVRLGLVITHFNRPGQVQPAVERLRRHVLQHPEFAERITLTVVDNSRSLTLAAGDGVTHFPNRNFGGSGGFARGLLALEDDGRTTHVLFMDDDASCEADAILRTYALLRYATSPRLAIAGALLDEAEPWQLLEKGACFDGKCRPLHVGRDVRHVDELLWAERQRVRPDYGGWWFFAFPLRGLEHYPFPFFVRGDDVFFSLANRFEIFTLNGIACLAEDFGVKHGPLTAYLDGRYHLVHAVLREQGRTRILRRLVSNQFVKPLFGYHYASARAFTLALRHVAQGPRFFEENLDLAAVRAQIGAWTPSEKMLPLGHPGLKLRGPRSGKEKPLRRLLRVMTLQGFLLPGALLINRRLYVHEKSFYGRGSAVFRFRRVLYEHWPSDTGYIAELDRTQFFRELRAFAVAMSGLVRRLPELRREYAEAVPRLTSRAFWREVYALAPAESRAESRAAVSAAPAPGRSPDAESVDSSMADARVHEAISAGPGGEER